MTPLPALLDGELPPGRLVVAVSGGVDSMVLLHQLRFGPYRRPDLVVAHLDHAMRPGSHRDAAWLGGVCRAWNVPLETARLPDSPGGEEAAREARYRFLRRVRADAGGTWVLTAHNADDQAETVLFRILRGTGVGGLAAMRAPRDGVIRPLLHRWRSELEAYARAHRVPFRDDPTNQDHRHARNALRQVVLPAAEAMVASGSRASLLRLSENAARARDELSALEEALLGDGLRAATTGRIELEAGWLGGFSEPVRRRLLRRAALELGAPLSRRASDLAVEAVSRLHPGQGLDLSGGLRLERGVREWILLAPTARAPAGARPSDSPVVRVPSVEPGAAVLTLGRASYRFAWGPRPGGEVGEVALPRSAPFPLTLRGWRPGDRIQVGARARRVAGLLGRAGVASLDRPSVPVAVDGLDRVVWVPGVAAAEGVVAPAAGGGDRALLYLRCSPEAHD